MESGPVCRPGSRPRMLMCYLCGREYGTRSLSIHIPQCQKRWLIEEENKPKNERRPLPPQPNAEKVIRSGGAQAFDSFNTEAFAAFEQTLQQCTHCQRRFLPKPFLHHQKGCTAANPAKPAGTGLISISLTNRLVPGAIAGSMHGKARTHPVPLRLCKPSEKSNSKLKMSRPASARPAWTEADDSFSFDDRDPGQSSNWNTFGVESRTQNRLTNSRPSSHHGNGGYGGGGKSHLVNTFGELWRTHKEDKLPITRHQGGRQEWCSQAETERGLSLSRGAANPWSKGGLSSQTRQIPSVLRSSQNFPRDRNLDWVSHGQALPSGQAEHNENYKLMQGKPGGDLRQQRRHH